MAKQKISEEVIQEPGEVLSPEQAQDYFSRMLAEGLYVIPEGQEVAYVAQDKQVFFHYDPARVWVSDVEQNKKKRLQLFEVKCL